METPVRERTRLILLIGFGSLLLLIALLGIEAARRADRIFQELASIQDLYRRCSTILTDAQTDLNRSGILIRDYLLDRDQSAVSEYRRRLRDLRANLESSVAKLEAISPPRDGPALVQLRGELQAYWDALEPVFDWTPEQKGAISVTFLRKEVIPRRTALLSMTRKFDTLNAGSLAEEQERIATSRAAYRRYLAWIQVISLCLAIATAVVSIRRISILEQRTDAEMKRTEEAERQLRWLSQKLVQTQEDERKAISRELHDEVGQLLTAIRMVFGNLDRNRNNPGPDFGRHVTEGRELTERTLQIVRNLALGLRPSMLDDLGLEPAIRWQTREFSRRSGIRVDFTTDGVIDGIPEATRTCLYRVVQESLTNCARHSRATNVRIGLHGGAREIVLSVVDDGVGFDSAASGGRGLGILGIGERVRELNGSVEVRSSPGHGTSLTASIPSSREVPA
jgi:signal transduction histidine kinase